jgi:hypothetical protein
MHRLLTKHFVIVNEILRQNGFVGPGFQPAAGLLPGASIAAEHLSLFVELLRRLIFAQNQATSEPNTPGRSPAAGWKPDPTKPAHLGPKESYLALKASMHGRNAQHSREPNRAATARERFVEV